MNASLLGLVRRAPTWWHRLFAGPPVTIDGQRLDTASQAILRVSGWIDGRTPAPVSLEAERASMRRSTAMLPPPPVAGVDTTVQGAVGPLDARVYRPAGLGARAPAIVYFHGGGCVVGDLDTHDELCGDLASRARAVVISVAYRLAPEHPFPAAVDDAEAAFLDVVGHPFAFGIDPGRVAVAGDSAGALLSTVTCRRRVEAGGALPAVQLLVYPATDVSREADAYETFGHGDFLTAARVRWFRGQYVPDLADRASPDASPLVAPDLSGQPPVLLIVCGFDPLRDDGLAYADALHAAGVDLTLAWYPGGWHGFFSAAPVLAIADDAVGFAARWLAARLHAPTRRAL